MKTVLATLPSLYSLYFLNSYLRLFDGQLHTVLVSTSPVTVDKRTVAGPQDIGFLLSRFGKRYTGFLLLNQLLMSYVDYRCKKSSTCDGIWSLSKLQSAFGFEVFTSSNFNSDQCIEQINRSQPDCLVVSGCNQILKSSFLSSFHFPCINIHPSKLPDDRGVDPVFQKAARGSNELSVSLHQITAGVDEGPILRQSDSVLAVTGSYIQSLMAHAHLGAELLSEHFAHSIAPQEQSDEIAYPYRSWPSKREIRNYLSGGGQLFNRRDLAAYLSFDIQWSR